MSIRGRIQQTNQSERPPPSGSPIKRISLANETWVTELKAWRDTQWCVWEDATDYEFWRNE